MVKEKDNQWEVCSICGSQDYGVKIGNRWACWKCIESWMKSWRRKPEMEYNGFAACQKCGKYSYKKRAFHFIGWRIVCSDCLNEWLDSEVERESA